MGKKKTIDVSDINQELLVKVTRSLQYAFRNNDNIDEIMQEFIEQKDGGFKDALNLLEKKDQVQSVLFWKKLRIEELEAKAKLLEAVNNFKAAEMRSENIENGNKIPSPESTDSILIRLPK